MGVVEMATYHENDVGIVVDSTSHVHTLLLTSREVDPTLCTEC
jgi:hypothetical protein